MEKRFTIVTNGLVVEFDKMRVNNDKNFVSLWKDGKRVAGLDIEQLRHKIKVLQSYKYEGTIVITYCMRGL